MPAVAPVTVVTGFLGAGKTTLLNEWLGQFAHGEVAVIVNEVGAVGIDGELLAERARTLVEIAGGCVCCATYGELVRALGEFAARGSKRIFIETSGAASPAGVVRAIRAEPAVSLDGIVTVVDGTRLDTLTGNELALEQIGYADVLVISRADRAGDDAARRLAAMNGTAVITSAERGAPREPLDTLLARRTEALPAQGSHPGAPIESIALTLEGEVDEERFGDFVETTLGAVAGRLLRMKGILAVAGVEPRMILQGVADEVEITFGEPLAVRACRLVIVGYGLDRAELAAAFNAASASPLNADSASPR